MRQGEKKFRQVAYRKHLIQLFVYIILMRSGVTQRAEQLQRPFPGEAFAACAAAGGTVDGLEHAGVSRSPFSAFYRVKNNVRQRRGVLRAGSERGRKKLRLRDPVKAGNYNVLRDPPALLFQFLAHSERHVVVCAEHSLRRSGTLFEKSFYNSPRRELPVFAVPHHILAEGKPAAFQHLPVAADADNGVPVVFTSSGDEEGVLCPVYADNVVEQLSEALRVVVDDTAALIRLRFQQDCGSIVLCGTVDYPVQKLAVAEKCPAYHQSVDDIVIDDIIDRFCALFAAVVVGEVSGAAENYELPASCGRSFKKAFHILCGKNRMYSGHAHAQYLFSVQHIKALIHDLSALEHHYSYYTISRKFVKSGIAAAGTK